MLDKGLILGLAMSDLSLDLFDYDLPEALIARFPLETRSASRLLCVPKPFVFEDARFVDLPNLLQAGDLLVFNDTRVMKARLFGQKASGGKVEVLVERILPVNLQPVNLQPVNSDEAGYLALCHIKASKSPKPDSRLWLADGQVEACVVGRRDNLFVVRFFEPVLSILQAFGVLPIPPYFNRETQDLDEDRYQTVFYDPNKLASVAAPTASLHFDEGVLQALRDKGVETTFVTLHVGAGTFAPVKTQTITDHKMHSEFAQLSQQSADRINQTKANGGRVIAVGTTVVRVLETAFLKTKVDHSGRLAAWQGDTDIFIYPPYHFGVVDALITNFHLPKSTLLMLVSAFAGVENVKQAYAFAIEHGYRFFSYGDAMFLSRQSKS